MQPLKPHKRIFIIAGEASGDMLGGGLMESLHYFLGKNVEIRGVGGEHMKAQGLRSIFPMREIALMGFAEILPHLWRILCRMKETCEAIIDFQPDVIITIDSPGFNFRIVEWVRKHYGNKIPCIHYVAPSVWAYKPERAAKTARLFDHLLTILPYEARYFEAHGLKTTFVGHTVMDDLIKCYQPPRLYAPDKPLHVAVFPGSRKAEIQKFLPVFRDTITLLRESYPNMHVSIPVNEMVLPFIEVGNWKHRPSLVLGETSRHQVMQNAHIALAKTGTITLEVAKYGLPMVAAYKVNKLTASMLRRMLNIPYVNLINILSGYEVIPELMQEKCHPRMLCNSLKMLVEQPELAQMQSAAAFKALEKMQNPNQILASDAAAEIIIRYLP